MVNPPEREEPQEERMQQQPSITPTERKNNQAKQLSQMESLTQTDDEVDDLWIKDKHIDPEEMDTSSSSDLSSISSRSQPPETPTQEPKHNT